jgi:hypothetical protein
MVKGFQATRRVSATITTVGGQMRTFGLALLISVAGYIVGVLLGVGLVHLTSTKPDRSMEAVMTGFFAAGPIVGVLTFIVALIVLRQRAP